MEAKYIQDCFCPWSPPFWETRTIHFLTRDGEFMQSITATVYVCIFCHRPFRLDSEDEKPK